MKHFPVASFYHLDTITIIQKDFIGIGSLLRQTENIKSPKLQVDPWL